ncbi:PEP-CTERM sorting domain-containing protein [Spirulina sp. CS-785/01]|uniref:PEP-CTERM sorting domain-containing protein n=1 Tax=Spirulina sp. CS-785/01 TaxID=3021716 RepID=UPI00232C429F|nr:PEP-CTERM sorting domain-containing protein [Spirulina sp. CS-785/01]MDB9315098.1 PEP-CTERM sorting domain-containing protein [Spirulina sp. CS-785/01]
MKSLPWSQNPLLKIAAMVVLAASVNVLTANTANAQRERLPQATLPDEVTQLILNQAAEDTNLPLSALQIESAFDVTWSNGCMGMRRPGQFCTMALVDGWRVSVISDNHELTYHTSGSRAFLAGGTLPTAWELEQRRREQAMWRRRWANIGWTQDNPVLPEIEEPGTWIFENVPSRRWYDPPTAYGFRYTMEENSLFTEIMDFPTNLDEDNLFTVSVGDTILGEFSPGESVNFVNLLGQGVSEFTVTDIDAPIDPNNPKAFPLAMDFNTEAASFRMKALSEPTSVPEPATTLSLLAMGILGISSRRKSQQ